MDAVQAAFGVSKDEADQTQGADDAATYDPKTDPHSTVETRDKKEKKSIKSQEYQALSNKHKHSRSNGHGRGKRQLYEQVEKAVASVRQQYKTGGTDRKRNAPFRVVVERPRGVERMYFWHGTDVLKCVCDVLIPCLKGQLDIKVQKRIGSKQAWHSGENQPHLCAQITADEPLFGLERMVQNFHWEPQKTRLPHLAAAKAMA